MVISVFDYEFDRQEIEDLLVSFRCFLEVYPNNPESSSVRRFADFLNFILNIID